MEVTSTVQYGLQQGDVLIILRDKIPEEATKLERHAGVIVVAKGESTGHAHVINDPGADMFVLTTKNGSHLLKRYYLNVSSPVIILHEEHKNLIIPIGIYEISRVKEYDYFFKRRSRSVID